MGATDPEGDGITYALRGTDIFNIHQTTGQITAAIALAGRGGTTYTMTATASDGINLPVGVEVLITVDLGAFPELSSPLAISEGEDGGSLDVSFGLPHRGFKYRLALYRSDDGETYVRHGDVVELNAASTSPHNFGSLDRSLGGYYRAGLKACRDHTDQRCGTEVESNIFTFPTPSVTISGLVSTYDNATASAEFTISITGITPDVAYRLELSTTDPNLGFDSNCNTREVHVGITLGETTLMRPNDDLYFCGPVARGSLIATVMRGDNAASSESFVVSVAPDSPSTVLVNGDNRGVSNADRWRLKAGWQHVAGTTQYRVRYRLECYSVPTDDSLADLDIVDDESNMKFPVDCSTGGSLTGSIAQASWSPVRRFDAQPSANGKIVIELLGLSQSTAFAGRHGKSVYRVEVSGMAGSALVDQWSRPSIGYLSDQTPGPSDTVSTVPATKRWPLETTTPPQTTPDYHALLCDSFTARTNGSNWENEIQASLDSWVQSTTFDGLWSHDEPNLFLASASRENSNNACDPSPTGDDRGKSELRVVTQAVLDMKCPPIAGTSTNACAARGLDPSDSSLFVDVDIWFVDALDPVTDLGLGTPCPGVRQTMIHEVGHALGLVPGHSNVKPSMMTTLKDDHSDICQPTYFDVAAIVAAYQSYVPN